jgi:hypothetical protein
VDATVQWLCLVGAKNGLAPFSPFAKKQTKDCMGTYRVHLPHPPHLCGHGVSSSSLPTASQSFLEEMILAMSYLCVVVKAYKRVL